MRYLLFYLFEIGFGCWLGWNGIFWLRFTSRRLTCYGFASVASAIILVSHGGSIVLWSIVTQSCLMRVIYMCVYVRHAFCLLVLFVQHLLV
jgi:hypothetical protein